MRILGIAMFGLTAAAASVWTFEGDWSSWDEPQGTDVSRPDDTRSYRAPASGTGEADSYGLRSMGRGEARWMGTLEGQGRSDGTDGNSRFDWNRALGRAEAYHVDGSRRTAAIAASHQAPDEPLTGKGYGCNLVQANRAEGRDEARTIKVPPEGAGKPPTTWEMDQESERKAASKAAGGPDC